MLRWLQLAPAANLINHMAVAGNLWLAKALTSDAEAVGVYAACYMLASTLLPTSAILSATCFRRMAGLVQSEPAAAAKILRTVLGGACMLTFLAIVAFALRATQTNPTHIVLSVLDPRTRLLSLRTVRKDVERLLVRVASTKMLKGKCRPRTLEHDSRD